MTRSLQLALLIPLLSACFEADLSSAVACTSEAQCAVGQTCYRQRCMAPASGYSGPVKQGLDAGPEAGPEAGNDAGLDAGSDAGADAGGATPDVGLLIDDELTLFGCLDLLEERPDAPSGYYGFDLDGDASTDRIAYCDMTYRGGGWTEIFRWNEELDGQSVPTWPTQTEMETIGGGAWREVTPNLLISLRDEQGVVRGQDAPTILGMPFTGWDYTNPFSRSLLRDEVTLSDNSQTFINWGNGKSEAGCSAFAGQQTMGGVWGKVCLENTAAPAFLGWAGDTADCCLPSNAEDAFFSGYLTCQTLCSNQNAYSLAIRAPRGGEGQTPYRDCAMRSAFDPNASDSAVTLDPDGVSSVEPAEFRCENDIVGQGWTLVYKRHASHQGDLTCQGTAAPDGQSRERLYETNLANNERACASNAMMRRHRNLKCTFRIRDSAPFVVKYEITSEGHTVADVLQTMNGGNIMPDQSRLAYTCSIQTPSSQGGFLPAQSAEVANSILPCQIFVGQNVLHEFFLAKDGGHFTSTDASPNNGHCFSR